MKPIGQEENLARERNEKPNPNNYEVFVEISGRTGRAATATPVQLYPVAAWDLLYILSQQ